MVIEPADWSQSAEVPNVLVLSVMVKASSGVDDPEKPDRTIRAGTSLHEL